MRRSWYALLVAKFGKCRPIRRARPRPLQLEALEDRVEPATFTEYHNALDLVLGTGEQLNIVSNGASYALALTAALGRARTTRPRWATASPPSPSRPSASA